MKRSGKINTADAVIILKIAAGMIAQDILSNEKYTGNALLQKHYKNNHIDKKKTKNTGELARPHKSHLHLASSKM